MTLGVSVRLKRKAWESGSGLRAEGLVMDEAELPRLCRRPWLDAVRDLDGAMVVRAVGLHSPPR